MLDYMPTEQQMKAALQAYIDGFNAKDAEALASLFADDATIEDPVGTQPIQGKETIAQFYRKAVKAVQEMKLSSPIRGSHSNAAAMAFEFTMNWEGKTMHTKVIDVMEFNQDGKITSMRAYWGPGDSRELGTDS